MNPANDDQEQDAAGLRAEVEAYRAQVAQERRHVVDALMADAARLRAQAAEPGADSLVLLAVAARYEREARKTARSLGIPLRRP